MENQEHRATMEDQEQRATMEDQEQRARGGRRRRRGGRARRIRAMVPGPAIPIITINEVLPSPRQQTPLDLVQRTFNVDINDYRISTTVTSSPPAIEKWLQDTCSFYQGRRRLIVGLSLQMGFYQTTPVLYYPHVQIAKVVDILQFCVGDRCLIIQLSRTPIIPEALRRFLQDHVFVGLFYDAGPEQHLFYHSRHRIVLPTENVVNLVYREVSSGVDTSMEAFAWREVGLILEFDPAIRYGYWGVEVLNEFQIVHACLEAYLARKIGVKWQVYRFF